MKRSRSLVLSLTAAVLLVGVAAFVLFLPALEKQAAEQLGRRLGLEVTLAGVSGTLLTSLDCQTLNARRSGSAASQPLAKLELRNLRLRWRAWELFSGVEAFLASLRIEAERLHVELDMSGEAEGNAPSASPSPALTSLVPPLLPALQIGSLDLQLRSGEVDFALHGASLAIEPLSHAASGQRVTLSAAELALQPAGAEMRRSSCSLSLVYRATGIDALVLSLPELPLELAGGVRWDATGKNAVAAQATLASMLHDRKVDLAFTGESDGERVTIADMAASFGENQLQAGRVAFPVAAVTNVEMNAIADLEAESLHLRLGDIPALLAVSGQALPLAETPAHLLEAQGRIAKQRLSLEQATFSSLGNTIMLSSGELTLPTGGQSLLAARLAASLRFAIDDPAAISTLFAIAPLGGRARGEATISGSLGRPRGVMLVEGDDLAYGECAIGKLRLDGEVDEEQLVVRSLLATSGDDRIEASGRYDFASALFTGARGRIHIAELASYLQSCLAYDEKVSGRLDAEFVTSANGELRAEIALSNSTINGVALQSARGAVTSNGKSVRLENARLVGAHGEVGLSLSVVPQGGEGRVRVDLREMDLASHGVRLALRQPASLLWSGNARRTLELAPLDLIGPQGRCALHGVVSPDGECELHLHLSELRGDTWLAEMAGSGWNLADGELRLDLTGTLAAPRAVIATRLAGIDTPWLALPLQADVRAEYRAGEGVSFKHARLSTARGHQVEVVGHLPWDPLAAPPFLARPFSLDGRVELAGLQGLGLEREAGKDVAGDFSGFVRVRGSWEDPQGEMQLAVSRISLREFFDQAPADPLSIDARARYAGKELFLDQCEVRGAPFSLQASGAWREIPSLAAFFREPGQQLPGRVDLQASMALPDVAWLTPKVAAVRRLSGTAEGTLRLRGAAARPELSANLGLAQGAVRLTDPSLPPVEGVTLLLALENRKLFLRQANGRFGGAPFSLSGSVSLEEQAGAVVDLRLAGENLLLHREEAVKVRGDVDLALRGPWERSRLAGTITLTDCRYGKNVDFLTMFRGQAKIKADSGMQLFSFSEPPGRDMLFDVEVKSGPQAVRLANNMARGAVRPALRLIGSGEVPQLIGRIYLEPTVLSVPAGRITVQSGVVTFSEHDPDHPRFDVSAASRLAGYDITMQLRGTSEAPVITLTSDPPLPDDELLMLVLTGNLPQTDSAAGSQRRGNMKMAVYLGRGLLARWFGGESLDSDESVLERFDLDFGRQISKSGQETVEASFRLIEDLVRPGDRLYLISEKDAYDNVNVGAKIVFRFP